MTQPVEPPIKSKGNRFVVAFAIVLPMLLVFFYLKSMDKERGGEREPDSTTAVESADKGPSLKQVRAKLKSKSWKERQEGAKAMVAQKDPKAIGHLVPLLEDKSKEVRRTALESIRQIQPEVDFHKKLLDLYKKSKDRSSRLKILRALVAHGDAGRLTEVLIRALRDRDVEIRLYAAEQLGNVTAKLDLVPKALVPILEADEDDSRVITAGAASLLKLARVRKHVRSLVGLSHVKTADFDVNHAIRSHLIAKRKTLLNHGVVIVEFKRKGKRLAFYPIRPGGKTKLSRLSLGEFLGVIYQSQIHIEAKNPKLRFEVHEKYTDGVEEEVVESAAAQVTTKRSTTDSRWIPLPSTDKKGRVFPIVKIDRPVASIGNEDKEVATKELILRVRGYLGASRRFEKRLRHRFLSEPELDF